MSDARTVLVEIVDGVATVTLNRPERHNAVDDAMAEQLVDAVQQVGDDAAVRVVVLRGAGRSFCSGRDTAQLGRRVDGESDLTFVRRHQIDRLALIDLSKPVIAELQGNVIGGGMELALAADIRIAADDVRMSLPEIRYGLMTDTGGSAMTAALAGPSRAKWLLMTGTPIDARRALEWGLVDEVVPLAQVHDAAIRLAALLAEHPGDALAMIKRTVNGTWRASLMSALDSELHGQVALFAGEDFRRRRDARQAASRRD